MLYSMTGFGRAVVTDNNHKITVEAKSLNSKQLDISMRLPSIFREVEMPLRDKLSKRIERGKVDVNVFVEVTGEDRHVSSDDVPRFNVSLLREVKKQIQTISHDLSVPEPSDWFQIFMRFPDVLHNDRPQPVAGKEETELLEKGLSECVDALLQFRRQEGATLEVFFRERLLNIAKLLQDVEKYESERVAKIKERIEEGLKKVPQVEHDKNRLEQELIFYIEKLDISEEKQRLAQHLRYFDETMNNSDGGQGKKLGFIAQEMGREINTLGSKSNHAEMQKIVVRMKDELEQIKEQVLNVL